MGSHFSLLIFSVTSVCSVVKSLWVNRYLSSSKRFWNVTSAVFYHAEKNCSPVG
jgi:hypothetical protein